MKLKLFMSVLFQSSSIICSSGNDAVNYVTFEGSSLNMMTDFTLCFRVLFNKISPMPFELVSSMETLTTPAPYYWSIGTIAAPCDALYQGCDELLKKELQHNYTHGNVYFSFRSDKQEKFFKTLSLGSWQSICLTSHRNKSPKVYLDGKIVVNISDYEGLFNSTQNIVLLRENSLSVLTEKEVKITEVTIWNETKTQAFVDLWSKCENEEKEANMKLLKTVSNNNNIMNITEEDRGQCKQMANKFITGSTAKKNLDDTIKYCSKLGGTIAVATDQEVLGEMIKVAHSLGSCKDGFFTGYSDMRKEGSWVDVVHGQNMTFLNWGPNEPDNFNKIDQDCCYYKYELEKFKDGWCTSEYCPLCELRNPLVMQMNGLCINTIVDTHYVVRNMTWLQGYMYTEIIRENENQWRLRKNGEVIAMLQTYIEDLPVGEHKWNFTHVQDICPDGNSVRTLNIHVKVEQPGHFCCRNGQCISSDKVCDVITDCDDKSDEELFMQRVVFPENVVKYDPGIQVDLTIFDVLDVNQEKSTFTVFFGLELHWKDTSYDYYFLKERNLVDKMIGHNNSVSSVWFPNLEFYHILENPLLELEKSLFIHKNQSIKPKMTGGTELLQPKEVYNGGEHMLVFTSWNQAEFLCSFDKIRNYPFGKQECTFSFFIKKSNAILEHGKLKADDISDIKEYQVSNLNFTCYTKNFTGGKPKRLCEVTVVFNRDLFSICVVHFFPAFILNIINLSSVYLQGDNKYDLILTLNVTIMMVLASVYLSVSSSLPRTPAIKPVETWLLFNILSPFLIITINIFMQVLEQKLSKMRESDKRENKEYMATTWKLSILKFLCKKLSPILYTLVTLILIVHFNSIY